MLDFIKTIKMSVLSKKIMSSIDDHKQMLDLFTLGNSNASPP